MSANPILWEDTMRAPTLRSLVRRPRVLAVALAPGFVDALERAFRGAEVYPIDDAIEAIRYVHRVAYDAIVCSIATGGPDLYRRVVATRPDVGSRFVFLKHRSVSARRHQFLGDLENVVLDDDALDLRSLGALIGA